MGFSGFKKYIFFAAAQLLPYCLLCCSQASPEISYGSLELVHYENGGRHAERFTFFILPHDADGFEDLEELWLYHDWEGLSWHLSSKNWVKEVVAGDTWIGSRAIAMADGGTLPRGQFRAVLIDKGGNRTERLYSFDFPVESALPFPSLAITGDNYTIVSEYPEQYFLVFDNEGNYLSTVTPPSHKGDVSALGLPSRAESMALWARHPSQSVSAFTDIVPLRD